MGATFLDLPSTFLPPSLTFLPPSLTFLDLPGTFLCHILDLPITFLDLPATFLDLPSTFLDLPSTFLDLPATFLDLPAVDLAWMIASARRTLLHTLAYRGHNRVFSGNEVDQLAPDQPSASRKIRHDARACCVRSSLCRSNFTFLAASFQEVSGRK